MANKYSKSNTSSRAQEKKTMQEYEERRNRLNKGAKVLAIIIIFTMVVFYVLSTGLSFME